LTPGQAVPGQGQVDREEDPEGRAAEAAKRGAVGPPAKALPRVDPGGHFGSFWTSEAGS
jgi:hypothetical protein